MLIVMIHTTSSGLILVWYTSKVISGFTTYSTLM